MSLKYSSFQRVSSDIGWDEFSAAEKRLNSDIANSHASVCVLIAFVLHKMHAPMHKHGTSEETNPQSQMSLESSFIRNHGNSILKLFVNVLLENWKAASEKKDS